MLWLMSLALLVLVGCRSHPEIPVNVYDLGLIYKIDVSDNGEVVLDMTLTAPTVRLLILSWKIFVRKWNRWRV